MEFQGVELGTDKEIEELAIKYFNFIIDMAGSYIKNDFDIIDYLKRDKQLKKYYARVQFFNKFRLLGRKVSTEDGCYLDFLLVLMRKYNLRTITKKQYEILVADMFEILFKEYKDYITELVKIELIEEAHYSKKIRLTEEQLKKLYEKGKQIWLKFCPLYGIEEKEETLNRA